MSFTIYCGKCRVGPNPIESFEEVIVNGDWVYWCKECAAKDKKTK